jgi:FkbM family methyltransferase
MRSESFWAYFESEIRPQLGPRAESTGRIFEYLDRFDRPVGIIETGCAPSPQPWPTPGGATALFDLYAEHHPGSVIQTIGADEPAAAARRRLVSERVKIQTGDSIAILHAFAQTQAPAPLDLLYLGCGPLDYAEPAAPALRALGEFIAISPLLRPDTLVVVDESPLAVFFAARASGAGTQLGAATVTGNGKYLADYARRVNAEPFFTGFQSGWTRLRTAPPTAPETASRLRGVIIDSDKGIFAVDSADQYVGQSLREPGGAGQAEIATVASLVTPEDDVLVVGAHIGTVAIGIAKHCRHVTAIEANPATFKLLKCNIILNDADNVTAHHLAASDIKETLLFVANTQNSGGSKRFPLVSNPDYFSDNPAIIKVPADSLDTRFAAAAFTLVFMDIEGSEYFALRGMERILSTARILIVEFLPHHLSDVAGVTPEEFAAALSPFFQRLYIPTRNQHVPHADFAPALRQLFNENAGDGGIIFSK